MAATTKFKFDTIFEAEDQCQAPEQLEEAAPPEPIYNEAELAVAREQGFADGHQAGFAEAQLTHQSTEATALTSIAQQIAALGPVYSEAMQRCQRDAIGIARAVSAKMVEKTMNGRALDAVEPVITDILSRILDEPRVVIRVSDTLLDPLQQRLSGLLEQSGFSGSLVLLAENGLQGPDCKIEWADGGAEYETETHWREIDDVIDRYLVGVTPVDDGVGIGSSLTDASPENQTNPEETPDG